MIGKGSVILRKTGKSDGFYITLTKNDELICTKVTNGRAEDKSEVLYSGGSAEFDAVIDKSNTVHMVFGNRHGEIVYLRNISGRWARSYLMKADGKSNAGMGRCFIFVHETVLSVICAVRNEETTAICHLLIGDEIGKPVIVGEFSGEYSNFFAVQGENKDISVFYCEKRTGSFGRKKFIWSEKGWSGFEELEKEGGNVSNVFAVSEKDRLDVCYKRAEELCYLRIAESAEEDRVVSRSSLTKRHSKNAMPPVLVHGENLLRLLWQSGRRIFMSETEGENVRWCRLREEMSGENTKIEIFKLSDAYSGRTVYNLGFADKSALFFYDGDEIFLKEPKKAERRIKREGEDAEVFAGASGNKEYSRADMEKEKKRLMDMMGIKRQADADVFTENFGKHIEERKINADKKEKAEMEDVRQSGRETECGQSLIQEIKRMNEMLGQLQGELEKVKGLMRIYAGRESGKKISVKVHKK